MRGDGILVIINSLGNISTEGQKIIIIIISINVSSITTVYNVESLHVSISK